MGLMVDLPLAGAATLLATQIGSSAAVWRRLGRPPALAALGEMPAISVLRPVCGLENHLEATLRSTFELEARDFEILFCVAREDDAAVPLVRSLIAAHPEVPARLLVGDDRATGNPKLDNLLKGWAGARHDWIVMADSNVLLPPGYLRQLVAAWTPGTGLVSSPAVGAAAEGLGARIEAAFLNGYQARWQLFADELGQGFAQGKTLFWRRDILEAGGGPVVLGEELAEDVASTKLVRGQGLKVRVARAAFPQPLGHRSLAEVWRRQVRWARVRRFGFPALYAGEIASGALPGMLLLSALALAGALPWLAVIGYLILWYGSELALAMRAGWSAGPGDLVASVLRDLMLPAVWIAGWAGSGFTWRGNAMQARPAAPVPDPAEDEVLG
jgi:ceramide glucosyltransferase